MGFKKTVRRVLGSPGPSGEQIAIGSSWPGGEISLRFTSNGKRWILTNGVRKNNTPDEETHQEQVTEKGIEKVMKQYNLI